MAKDKATLSPEMVMESRMSFINKYGFKGALVLVLSLTAPYAGSVLDSYMNKQLVRSVKAEVSPLVKKINNMETLMLRHDGGIKTLRSYDIYYIAKMAVAKQSIDKIAEIHLVLERFEDRTGANKTRVKSKIREILLRNSSVYVTELNRYQQRGIGLVGDYIKVNFPMKEFLDAVYIIALAEGVDNPTIEDDIMLYMLETQKAFFDTMLTRMRAAEV